MVPVWCRHHLARYVDFNSKGRGIRIKRGCVSHLQSVLQKTALVSCSARAVMSLYGRVHLTHTHACQSLGHSFFCNGSLEEEKEKDAAAQTERAGGHSATRLLLPCRLTCLARWSLRMKRRSHSWQQNLFSPV